ncbi:MAG: flagellar export chaperone FlgN [Armatimonadota bacterium]
MTIADLSSILQSELSAGELLVETLDQQRRALIERDLDRITELTGILEGQMERFSALVDARAEALSGADDLISAEGARVLQRIRQTEGRVLRLATLNQDLIADRLAYVGAMLSTIGITNAAGYGAGPHAAAAPGATSRSA